MNFQVFFHLLYKILLLFFHEYLQTITCYYHSIFMNPSPPIGLLRSMWLIPNKQQPFFTTLKVWSLAHNKLIKFWPNSKGQFKYTIEDFEIVLGCYTLPRIVRDVKGQSNILKHVNMLYFWCAGCLRMHQWLTVEVGYWCIFNETPCIMYSSVGVVKSVSKQRKIRSGHMVIIFLPLSTGHVLELYWTYFFLKLVFDVYELQHQRRRNQL